MGSVGILWVLFAVYGVYLGLTDGVSKAFLVDLASRDDRGAALGMQAALTGISALPASIVAGFLWQKIGPGAAFAYGAITAAVAGALLFALGLKPAPVKRAG